MIYLHCLSFEALGSLPCGYPLASSWNLCIACPWNCKTSHCRSWHQTLWLAPTVSPESFLSCLSMFTPCISQRDFDSQDRHCNKPTRSLFGNPSAVVVIYLHCLSFKALVGLPCGYPLASSWNLCIACPCNFCIAAPGTGNAVSWSEFLGNPKTARSLTASVEGRMKRMHE